jgi:hypothetical protein
LFPTSALYGIVRQMVFGGGGQGEPEDRSEPAVCKGWGEIERGARVGEMGGGSIARERGKEERRLGRCWGERKRKNNFCDDKNDKNDFCLVHLDLCVDTLVRVQVKYRNTLQGGATCAYPRGTPARRPRTGWRRPGTAASARSRWQPRPRRGHKRRVQVQVHTPPPSAGQPRAPRLLLGGCGRRTCASPRPC